MPLEPSNHQTPTLVGRDGCWGGVDWISGHFTLLRSDFAQSTVGHSPNGDLTDSFVPSDGRAARIERLDAERCPTAGQSDFPGATGRRN
jgi:hypothetical protein